MIVVDTNVIAYLLIAGDRSEECEQLLRKDATWVAPILWRSELRNILSLYVRQQILSLEDALQIMNLALELMQNHEYDVVSHEIIRLAAEHACSAYDAEFVALANELDVPFVTVDRQLLQRFRDRAISPDAFLAG